MSSIRLPLPRGLFAVCFGLLLATPAGAQTSKGQENDLLEQTRRMNQIAAQKVESEIRLALGDAQRLAQSDYKKAVERLNKALTALEQDAALTPSRRESLVRMLEDRIRVTESDGDNAVATAAALDEKQAQATTRRATEERETREVEKTREKLKEVTNLRKEGRTEEASKLAAELAKEQPHNSAAQVNNRLATAHDQLSEVRKLQAEAARRRVALNRDTERSALLPNGDVEFPKDWKERTKGRKTTIQLTAKERAILQALSTPVTVNFRGTRFEDVIEYLQTLTGQAILPDKGALDEVQVSYDTPVTANVKGVTVRTLLRKILAELNLTYVVKDEVIQITSLPRAREMMTVRSYYIADVVAGVGWQNPVQIIQNINSIIDMIQSSVDPQSWRVNGGSGTITFNAGTMSLIIKQSAEVHSMLGGGLLR